MNDEELFEELDSFSADLRSAAGGLLTVLKKMDDKPKHVLALSETLKKLQTTDIEFLDDVILEFNEKAQQAALQSFKPNQTLMPEFLKQSDILVAELTKLTKKAFELNKLCD